MREPYCKIAYSGKTVAVYLGAGLASDLPQIMHSLLKGDKALVVTDSNVHDLHAIRLVEALNAAGIPARVAVLKAGEAHKNLDSVAYLYSQMNAFGMGRKDIVIALGGGVTGDTAGFAAATYMRGLPYIQVPTTLLADIDSSIGGKTGVDLPYGKNLAGAFYQPEAVIIDTEYLSTLPEEYIKDGMGEVIKYGIIRDKALFEKIKKGCTPKDFPEIIGRCVDIKAAITSADEHEGGERMLLNFGHTYGHAIEKCMNFTGISHGMAVGVGMLYALRFGEKLGITRRGMEEELKAVLTAYGMPAAVDISIKELKASILSDKKRQGGRVSFVFAEEIGKAFIKSVGIEELGEMK